MPDVEPVQASAPQVTKRDLTIRVGTVRNHNYHSSKTAEMPYKSYLRSGVSSRQWDKCTVRMERCMHRAHSRPLFSFLFPGIDLVHTSKMPEVVHQGTDILRGPRAKHQVNVIEFSGLSGPNDDLVQCVPVLLDR